MSKFMFDLSDGVVFSHGDPADRPRCFGGTVLRANSAVIVKNCRYIIGNITIISDTAKTLMENQAVGIVVI